KYDGARLSAEQKELRAFYGRLVNLIAEPAFRDGVSIPLNPSNRDNPSYGRLPNEQASGHWLYSFCRYDSSTKQRFVVIVNLNATNALKDVVIKLPEGVLTTIGLPKDNRDQRLQIKDRLNVPALADVTTSVG